MIKETFMNLLNVLVKPKEFFSSYKPAGFKEMGLFLLVITLTNPFSISQNLVAFVGYLILLGILLNISFNASFGAVFFVTLYSIAPKFILNYPYLTYIGSFWAIGLTLLAVNEIYKPKRRVFVMIALILVIFYLLVI